MQAIFEARLMDYPEELSGKQETVILSAFLRGYQQIRPFTTQQSEAFPWFYALVSAFWLSDIKWDENSLANALASGNTRAAHEWMREIYRRELSRLPMPA
jgi:Ser/Thr protein kinase RdoA (MazF antagonist)